METPARTRAGRRPARDRRVDRPHWSGVLPGEPAVAYRPRHWGTDTSAGSENITPGTDYRALIGTAFVHDVVDDNSRVAYAEICADEKAVTAIGVLERALGWLAERGVTAERVLSGNESAYKSYAWQQA